jgi:hypothetical protein
MQFGETKRRVKGAGLNIRVVTIELNIYNVLLLLLALRSLFTLLHMLKERSLLSYVLINLSPQSGAA